jgi:hypothetical protein
MIFLIRTIPLVMLIYCFIFFVGYLIAAPSQKERQLIRIKEIRAKEIELCKQNYPQYCKPNTKTTTLNKKF